jgi:ribosomal protein S27AE
MNDNPFYTFQCPRCKAWLKLQLPEAHDPDEIGFSPPSHKNVCLGLFKLIEKKRCPDCHNELTVTEKGDHWCDKCHWTDDDDLEIS